MVGIAVATIVASTDTMKTARPAATTTMRRGSTPATGVALAPLLMSDAFASTVTRYFRTMSSVTSMTLPITGSSRVTGM